MFLEPAAEATLHALRSLWSAKQSEPHRRFANLRARGAWRFQRGFLHDSSNSSPSTASAFAMCFSTALGADVEMIRDLRVSHAMQPVQQEDFPALGGRLC